MKLKSVFVFLITAIVSLNVSGQNTIKSDGEIWPEISSFFSITTLADQKTAEWTLVQTDNINDPARSSASTLSGTLTLRGNTGTNTNVETEIWAISKWFDIGEVDFRA